MNARRGRLGAGNRRGSAMVLAMVAVTVALMVSMTFMYAQSTAVATAQTIESQARARAGAESGMAMAVAFIESSGDWRARMPSDDDWIAEHAFAGGHVTIAGQDGRDDDGDGIVESDGNLNDDDRDPVTLTAVGTFEGVTHTVDAVITPVAPRKRLLMVVPDPARLRLEDEHRRTQFTAWGFDVTLIDQRVTAAAMTAAAAEADVAYIPESVHVFVLSTKLRDAAIGVVCEQGYLNWAFGIASYYGFEYAGRTQIDIVDNTHFITRHLDTGALPVVDDYRSRLRYIYGRLAPDARVLAQRYDRRPVFAALEAGDRLADSGIAAGRRVALPWAGRRFQWNGLTTEGLELTRRSLVWASQRIVPGRVAHWSLDEVAGTTAIDEIGDLHGIYRNGVAIGLPATPTDDMAAGFDGINDHVEIAHDDALLLDEGTLVFSFRTDRPSGRQGLISKDSRNYDTGGHLSIWLQSRRLRVRLQSTRRSYDMLTPRISTGTWHHVAMSFGPSGMRLYLNGALVDSDAYTGGLGSTSGGAGNFEPMAFGVLATTSADLSLAGWRYPLLGRLNEISVYDRALTPAEVLSLIQPSAYSVEWRESL